MAPVTRQLADLTVPFLGHESDDEDDKDGDKDAKGKTRGTREKKKEKKEKKKSRNGGEAAISVAASELCEVLIESVDADAVGRCCGLRYHPPWPPSAPPPPHGAHG